MTLEQVRQLMTEIGPAMELAGVAEYGEGEASSWALLVGEDLELWVGYEADRPELLLSASLGRPPTQGREALFENLLVYNGQREETGCVVIALSGPDGELVQSFALPAHGLDLIRLVQVVTNFAEVWRGWREIIVAVPSSVVDDDDPGRHRGPADGVKV